jgi:hypothetical protein
MFDEPKSETTRTHKGQIYVYDRTEPHTRIDGSSTFLTVWKSHCAECGEPFEFRTTASARRFQPNRRCQKHKRPGCRVRSAGGVA